jgi:hypothetical protein
MTSIAASEVGPPVATLEWMDKLEAKGVTFGEHVGQAKTGKEGKCPFLSKHPELLVRRARVGRERGGVQVRKLSAAICTYAALGGA